MKNDNQLECSCVGMLLRLASEGREDEVKRLKLREHHTIYFCTKRSNDYCRLFPLQQSRRAKDQLIRREDYYRWELAAAREIYGNPWVVRGDFNVTRFTEALKGKLREWNLANIGSCKERKVISQIRQLQLDKVQELRVPSNDEISQKANFSYGSIVNMRRQPGWTQQVQNPQVEAGR